MTYTKEIDSFLENDILNNVDWTRIHKTMKFLKWKWCMFGEETKGLIYPSIPCMRNFVKKELVRGVKTLTWDTPTYTAASGGFYIEVYLSKDDISINAEVFFNLTEWSSGKSLSYDDVCELNKGNNFNVDKVKV